MNYLFLRRLLLQAVAIKNNNSEKLSTFRRGGGSISGKKSSNGGGGDTKWDNDLFINCCLVNIGYDPVLIANIFNKLHRAQLDGVSTLPVLNFIFSINDNADKTLKEREKIAIEKGKSILEKNNALKREILAKIYFLRYKLQFIVRLRSTNRINIVRLKRKNIAKEYKALSISNEATKRNLLKLKDIASDRRKVEERALNIFEYLKHYLDFLTTSQKLKSHLNSTASYVFLPGLDIFILRQYNSKHRFDLKRYYRDILNNAAAFKDEVLVDEHFNLIDWFVKLYLYFGSDGKGNKNSLNNIRRLVNEKKTKVQKQNGHDSVYVNTFYLYIFKFIHYMMSNEQNYIDFLTVFYAVQKIYFKNSIMYVQSFTQYRDNIFKSRIEDVSGEAKSDWQQHHFKNQVSIFMLEQLLCTNTFFLKN